MKISFMTFACPQWDLAKVVGAAVDYGYHGIEFRCDANHAHGIEPWMTPTAREEACKRLADAGISACCLATSLQFVRPQVMEQFPARLDLCADMEIRGMRVFCGQPEDEGMKMPEAIEQVAAHLSEAAELAAQAGVQLWLETHDFMSRGADAAAAVRMVNHPLVGLNYDNMHPYRRGESLERTVAAVSGLVRHTHLHDALNKDDTVVVKPLGEGDMPMDDMFEALVKMGFDGYLSGEWFNTMYGDTPEQSLPRYHRDMTELASRHGIKLGQ